MNDVVDEFGGGLAPDREFFLPTCPDDIDMRESTSVWFFEENGAFAITRIGVEAEASSWSDRLYHGSVAFPNGRVLRSEGRGMAPSTFDQTGRPAILGAGPLVFRMIEPFRRWHLSFAGSAVETSVQDQIAGRPLGEPEASLSYDMDIEMATPGWVQDNSPEKVALMSPGERADAASMGLGWRIEHQFHAVVELTLDGVRKTYRGVGNRIKRQSVRPLSMFRGHVWQAGLFPDGRAFAVITYPPLADGSTYNEGYVYLDGRMRPARATTVAWLRHMKPGGADVSLELSWDGGVARIEGVTA